MDEKNSIKTILIGIILAIILLILIASKTSIIPFVTNSFSETNNYKNNNVEIPKVIKVNPCKDLTGESKLFCENKNKKCSDDSCYFKKAQLNSNEFFCFEIKDINLRSGCSVVVVETKAFELSVVNDDLSFCDNLINNRKIDCYDNYYLSYKYNSDSKVFCENISNENLKMECLN